MSKRKPFLEMQFNAQHSYYREQYPEASYSVILNNGERVGRLYVHRTEEIRILDIAVLPQHRRAGIGTSLIRGLLAEASETGKAVSIWIEFFNPSFGLFERLGFSKAQEDGANCLLEHHSKR